MLASRLAHQKGTGILQGSDAPIFFAIPLRGASSSINWDNVCLILEDTLSSIEGQTSRDFEVLVACHEIPAFSKTFTFPIEFIQTDREKPTDRMEQLFDKRHKKMLLAEEICRRGGGYMVMLDSDDLVSNKLVSHIDSNRNDRGFSIDLGYVFDVAKRKLEPVSNFSKICGSCAVFYLEAGDADATDAGWVYQIGDAMHKDFSSMAATLGRPLEPINFPAVIYMRNHGENHTSIGDSTGTVARLKEKVHYILNTAVPGRRVSAEVQKEFSMGGL